MNKMVFVSMVAMLSFVGQARAATGTGQAHLRVIQALQVSTVSNLEFSEAAAGAGPEVVNADVAETPQNANFAITGEPGRAIAVTLPPDGTVVLTSGGGGVDAEVAVNGFTSNNPTALDAAGATNLFVGATREALSPTQASGDYAADFTVDVVYQ